MGSLLGGGSNTTTSSSSPPPQVLANYQGLVNRATGVANTPYTAYPGEQVAPLSNQTVTGLANVDQYGYAAQPYLGTAGNMIQGAAGTIQQGENTTASGLGGMQSGSNTIAGAIPQMGTAQAMTQAAAQPVSAQQFSGDQLDQYLNPFTSDVVQATQNEFNNQNIQQAQFLNSQNIGAGAFGGDRAGISQAILAGQQQLSEAPVIAGLNQANYNQALAEFNNQQQTNLGASEFSDSMLGQMANQYGNEAVATGGLGTAQANIGALEGTLGTQQAQEGTQYMNAGTSYGNIGTQAQQAGLQGANAQMQAGMIPQNEQQAIDTALQNDWTQGQAYPFQTTGFLGNIIEGTGSQSGGTSQTTTPAPSGVSQAVGLGTAALGAASNPAVTSGLGSIGSALMSALPLARRAWRAYSEGERQVRRSYVRWARDPSVQLSGRSASANRARRRARSGAGRVPDRRQRGARRRLDRATSTTSASARRPRRALWR